MIKQAEANAEEDKVRRELVDAKNKAESLAHTIDGQLKEHGEKLGDEDKETIETNVTAVREALEGEDVAAITAATEALEQSAMKLGEIIYSDQAGGGDAASADAAASEADADDADDDIVDADFEEVDDDKK